MSDQPYLNKTVLAIGAHPDDIEFGSGATMAMLKSQGAALYFVVCTDGNRGSRQHQVEKAELVLSRQHEQQAAADILGADEVVFLNEEDGNLQADLRFKEQIVHLIRRIKPDMVFTHDPSWYYQIREDGTSYINHNDHRACGEAVLDAVYPLARDLQSFPEHANEGLTPHIVPEVYLFHSQQPNHVFDVAEHVQTKIASIHAHASQIDDPDKIRDFMTKRATELGAKHHLKAAEGFMKLSFT